jgi:hypothetical protein
MSVGAISGCSVVKVVTIRVADGSPPVSGGGVGAVSSQPDSTRLKTIQAVRIDKRSRFNIQASRTRRDYGSSSEQ